MPEQNLIRKIEGISAEQGTRNLLLFTLGTNSGLRISDILKLIGISQDNIDEVYYNFEI